jgi:hypothetical protein
LDQSVRGKRQKPQWFEAATGDAEGAGKSKFLNHQSAIKPLPAPQLRPKD